MNLKFYVDKALLKIKLDVLFGIKNRSKGDTVTVKMASLKHPVMLRKNTSDIEAFYQIFYYKGYDTHFRVTPKVIFDCGANVGLASIYFKNRYPDATIIAIEPEQSNYDVLVENTKSYPGIHCVRSGIWNKSTLLKIEDSGGGHWGFVTREVDKADKDTIVAKSIGDLMSEFNIGRVDLMKIDIESSEKELFAENTEWMSKVDTLLIELHDGMKEGCTRSFFKAMVNYPFTMRYKGENIICEFL